MNKLFAKIAGVALGLSLAIGVGAAVSSRSAISVHALDGSLAFSSGSFANSKITWTSSGVLTVVQEQNGAQSAVNSTYVSAPRWYTGHKITFSPASGITITQMSFTATTAGYATALANSTWSIGTASASASSVTWTGSANSDFTVVLGGQSRLSTGISLVYSSGGGQETPSVTSVSVNPTSMKLDLNGNTTGTITPTVVVTGGAAQTVNWSVENANPTGCISVEDGEVTANAVGTATVKATSTVDNTKSATCSVQVINTTPPAGSVTVTTSISTYATNNSWADATQYSNVVMDTNITATASGGSNTGKYYNNGQNWRLYQNESPTLVVAATKGATINLIKITYEVSNTGVLLDEDDEQVESGSAVGVNATSYTFGVGNTSSATNGQVRITEIEVNYTPTTTPSVTITSESGVVVEVGKKHTYQAVTENPNDATVTWSTSAASVATINSSTGELTAVAPGVVDVIATITVSGTDYTDSVSATVCPAHIKPASLQALISDSNADGSVAYEIEVVIKGWGTSGTDASAAKYGNMVVTDGTTDLVVYGATADATRLAYDGTNLQYVYSSLDTFLTNSVTKNLKISDKLYITCIRSEHNSVKQINAIITGVVVEELEGIVASAIKTEYTQGDSVLAADFEVLASYTVAGDVIIDSSDCDWSPKTLTTAGNAIEITVTYGGKSDTYTVKVNENVIPITSATLTPATANVHLNETLQMNLSISPANTTEDHIWDSSDESVATVSDSGLVTPVAVGTTTITVSFDTYQDLTSTITVVAANPTYEVTDVLVADMLAATTSSYVSFSGVEGTKSDAIYAGSTAKNTANSESNIQLRDSNSSGIVSTTSGGYVSSIEISWTGNTAAGRVISIYGSNEAYTSAGDLYSNSAHGTLLGELTKEGTAEDTKALTISGQYKYIGIRSKSGAQYPSEIKITWTKYILDSEIEEANTFAANFLSALRAEGVCDTVNGTSTNTTNLSSVWTAQKGIYENLSDGAKAFIRTKSAVRGSQDNVECMKYTYSHILTVHGDLNLEDFMNQGTTTTFSLVKYINNNNSKVIVVIISVATLLVVGGYFFLRKRKEQ